jgi:hypothetical protein
MIRDLAVTARIFRCFSTLGKLNSTESQSLPEKVAKYRGNSADSSHGNFSAAMLRGCFIYVARSAAAVNVFRPLLVS